MTPEIRNLTDKIVDLTGVRATFTLNPVGLYVWPEPRLSSVLQVSELGWPDMIPVGSIQFDFSRDVELPKPFGFLLLVPQRIAILHAERHDIIYPLEFSMKWGRAVVTSLGTASGIIDPRG